MGFQGPNYTQVPNALLGQITGDGDTPGLMAEMGMAELKVTLALCRLTFGFHQNGTWASLTRLQELTGLSRQSAHDGAEAAVERGLFTKDTSRGVTRYCVVVEEADQGGLASRPASLATRPPSRKETGERNQETSEANASGELSGKALVDSVFGEKETPPPPTPGHWSETARGNPWLLWGNNVRARSGVDAACIRRVGWLIEEKTGLRPGDKARSGWFAACAEIYQEAGGDWAAIEAAIRAAWGREPRYRPTHAKGFVGEARKARAAAVRPVVGSRAMQVPEV